MANMNSMTAIIIPLSSSSAPPRPTQPPSTKPPSGGAPDQTLPGELPAPSHPIYYPLPPGAPVDPEYGVPEDGPYPDQGLPGSQPGVDNTLPGSQPRPDQGLPGSQPKPDNTLPGGQGGTPTHPIVLPPDAGGGWGPIYIWGGGPGARPPIAIPPEGQQPQGGKITWKAVWTPSGGWQTIGVVIPEGPAPTPSKRK